MATANGYNDDDRKRIVSAMQSMRDRLGGFLAKTYGDNFDGDIDTMLEAVNFMKAVRIEKPAAVPVADALRDSLGAMEAHARMYPHMDKGFMVDARNKAKRALSTQVPPAAVPEGYDEDEIADACMMAEVSDSKYEAIITYLSDNRRAMLAAANKENNNG